VYTIVHILRYIYACYVIVTAANATEVERLTKENSCLRQEVERLKQELTAAEVQHGGMWYIVGIYHLQLICLLVLGLVFLCVIVPWITTIITELKAFCFQAICA